MTNKEIMFRLNKLESTSINDNGELVRVFRVKDVLEILNLEMRCSYCKNLLLIIQCPKCGRKPVL